MVRTYTNSCRKDSTWGVRPGVVWVTAGCQAQFRTIGGTGGGGGGSSVIPQRAEASCRAEAKRQHIAVLNVTPARNQGSYWQATVHGKLRGHPVAADCRYDPQSNRSSLFVDQGGGSAGGGSTELKVRAETACLSHAKRVGYAVVGQSAAVVVQSGLTVALQLKQGNALYQASFLREPQRQDPAGPGSAPATLTVANWAQFTPGCVSGGKRPPRSGNFIRSRWNPDCAGGASVASSPVAPRKASHTNRERGREGDSAATVGVRE